MRNRIASLDGIVSGLQIHGVGYEAGEDYIKLGFVIPKDIAVAAKQPNRFGTYTEQYQLFQKIKMFIQGFYNKQFVDQPLSQEDISIFDGLPAREAWQKIALYGIDLTNLNYVQLGKYGWIRATVPTQFK